MKNRKKHTSGWSWHQHKICVAKNAGTGKCSSKRAGRFCTKHAGQYRSGIIDFNGKKLRDFLPQVAPRKYHGCIMAGTDYVKDNNNACTVYTTGRFCKKHAEQYKKGIIDKNGKVLREKKWNNKIPECAAKNSGTGKCSHFTVGKKFCNSHRSKLRRGIIDANGRKIRGVRDAGRPNIYNECIAKDAGTGECSRYFHGKLCNKHIYQYYHEVIDINGRKIRDFKKPLAGDAWSKREKFTNCVAKDKEGNDGIKCSGYIYGRFCSAHRVRFHRGIIDINGNRIAGRVLNKEIVCGIPGCHEHGGFKSGLCQRHYVKIVAQEHFERFPSLNKPLDNTMKVEKVHWNS